MIKKLQSCIDQEETINALNQGRGDDLGIEDIIYLHQHLTHCEKCYLALNARAVSYLEGNQ